MEKPKIKQNIDITQLKKICKQLINSIENGDYHEDSDISHYIYEVALETIYGKEVWKYINGKMES